MNKIILIIMSLLSMAYGKTDLSNPLFSNFETWKKDFKVIQEDIIKKYPNTKTGKIYQGFNLYTDYLFIPAQKTQRNLIVLNSGIHGVEAPAGVYIQHDFLNNCLSNQFDLSDTSILIVHVMNPYGAKFGRRFNGNNVDLNRNCYVHEDAQGENFPGKHIKNEEYVKLHPFFTGKIRSMPSILLKALTVGFKRAYKALNGQYEYPTGVYYGGTETQPECRNVQDLVSEYVETHQNIFLGDIHTGLGSKGINQIIHSKVKYGSSPEIVEAKRKQKMILSKMFPEQECKGICQFGIGKKANRESALEPMSSSSSNSSTGNTGTFDVWLNKKFHSQMTEKVLIGITAEIGTVWGPRALRAVLNENYCHHNTKGCDEKCKAKWTRKLRFAFAPVKRQKWVGQVKKISNQMCKALNRFSKLK